MADPKALYQQALNQQRRSNLNQALALVKQSLALDPSSANSRLLAGSIYYQLGELQQALAEMNHAVSGSSAHPAALANRSAVLLSLNRFDEAVADANAAIGQDDDNYTAWVNLAKSQQGLHQYNDAAEAFARAWRLRTDDWISARQQVHCLLAADRLQAALSVITELLAQRSDDRELLLMRANTLTHVGELDAALDQYQRLLALHPNFDQAHSTYLIARQLSDAATPQNLLVAHQQWAERHAAAPIVIERRSSARPLRVGWISPRYCSGPVATFFLPVLRQLDRQRMNHTLISNYVHSDHSANAFNTAAPRWIDSSGWSDDHFIEQIRAERFDVLVDLSGHAPHHRLKALSQRCAQVQLSWLDYFCTTGLAAMDGLISDAYLTPFEQQAHFSERLLYLPQSRVCYSPPADAPDPLESPANSVPLLACFNRLNKINDATLRTWSAILQQLPEASLLLKSSGLSDSDDRTACLQRLARFGVDSTRVELESFGSYAETLERYQAVTLALDPFPFSGCATTADALWMGVPVITLAGDTMVSRQSASLLQAIGATDLIAESVDEYVSIATALAGDRPRLAGYRRSLRDKMAAAHNVADFTAALEDVIEQGWRELAREAAS